MTPSTRSGFGRLALGAVVAVPGILLAASVSAAPISDIQNEVARLESKARSLGVDQRVRTVSEARQAESRLVDAQVLYTLKDYTRAAILLLDYVTKHRTAAGYPEAVFFLADSLYQTRNFLSAKKYFRDVVTMVKGPYYQEALQRLVELSLRLGETSQIAEYLQALASIPPKQLKPSVPYVVSKYYFFRDQLDQAIQGFRQIPAGSKYHLHAQYFIGVGLVKKKDYAGGAKVFEGVLRLYPRSKLESHVRDLAYMAMGRLYYEKGMVAKAIGMYEKVPRTSPEFDTALYEIAWAYVKKMDYRRALRALELLDLANPNSPFIPEVKVLQGNLLIRLKQWSLATDLFSSTRERFLPVYDRMKQVMDEHADPNVFFDLLLARNVGKFAIKIQVPDLAIHWVKDRQGVKRALNLVADVRTIKDDITEATKLIKQLERTVNSPAKIKIFPEFAEAKEEALEVENRSVAARLEVLGEERAMVERLASASQKDELQSLAAQRARLERHTKDLPKSAQEYQGREKDEQQRLEDLSKELNRLSITSESLRAQVVAAEKYFEDTAADRSKDMRESFRAEVKEVREVIEALQEQVEEAQQEVRLAKDATGVGGPAEVAERTVKLNLRRLIGKEQELLASLRSGLDGNTGRDFDALAALMERLQNLDTFLDGFDGKLNETVERKLSSIRTILAEEKDRVVEYEQELTACRSETDQTAGNLTYASFHDVAKKFYEIVVRADVGIIDVAWALKDARSKEVSHLVRQRNADLKMLDDDFREVLQEQ